MFPIGEAQLLEGLRKELQADFYTVTTRPAAAYRGNPFQVEVGIAFGRPGEPEIEVDASGHMRKKKAQDVGAAEQLIAAEGRASSSPAFREPGAAALPAV